MKTNYELIQEFHTAFNKIPDPEKPTQINRDMVILRAKLMFEEFKETLDEMGISLKREKDGSLKLVDKSDVPGFDPAIDLSKLSKELADLLYVVYGTAAAFGIPIDEVYQSVHVSNMSKLGPDGKPVYREDGKVLKGPNYQPPQIREIIDAHSK